MLAQQPQVMSSSSAVAVDTSAAGGDTSATRVAMQAGAVKKTGVSGECITGPQIDIIREVDKDFRSKQLIKNALLDNSFLSNYLDSHQLRMVIDAMYEMEFNKATFIIEQGTQGSHFYVIAYGHCEIIVKPGTDPLYQLGPGKVFGELAILYNCTRTASVRGTFLDVHSPSFDTFTCNVLFVSIVSICVCSNHQSSNVGSRSHHVSVHYDENRSRQTFAI